MTQHYTQQLMALSKFAPVQVVAMLPTVGLLCLVHLDDGVHPITIAPPADE